MIESIAVECSYMDASAARETLAAANLELR
jgi:hypothetical protein